MALLNNSFIQVKIYLPKIPYNDIELDVKDTFLDCRTKLKYLQSSLQQYPHYHVLFLPVI